MWKHVTYIKKGLSHEIENLDCQDSIQIHEDENCMIAALADGLGSLKYSALASKTATAAACQWLAAEGIERLILDTPEQEALFRKEFSAAVSGAVRDAALQNSIKPKQLDCTLAFVYISKLCDYALAGMIGDSAVCVITEGASYAITDSGSFAGGTRAVQDHDAGEHMLLNKCSISEQKIIGFILTSDGLDNEIYIKGSNHVNQAAEEYFNALVEQNPEEVLRQAIENLTCFEDTPFDDDISIAVISRAEGPVELDHDPRWLCTCGCRNVLQNTYCVECNEDFTKLYSSVRFREHGGKAAFFKRINKTPEEERKLIGLPPLAPVVNDQTTGDVGMAAPMLSDAAPETKKNENSQDSAGKLGKKSEREEKRIRSFGMRGHFALAAAAVFALGAIAGMLVGRISTRSKVDELMSDMVALRREIESKDALIGELSLSDAVAMRLPEEHIVLDDGSYYWGCTDDEIPEGNGILLKEDVFYFGSFVKGMRNGKFLVIPVGDEQKMETIEYIMDVVADAAGIHYTVLFDDINVRNMPGTEGTVIIGNLSKGQEVIATGATKDIDQTQWAEIYWNDGSTAWVIADRIRNPENGENTEPVETAPQSEPQNTELPQEQPTEPEQTVPPVTEQAQTIYKVVSNKQNVRNLPGEEGTEVIGKALKDDLLTGTGNEQMVGSTRWVEVVWSNTTGWVSAKWLEKVE